MLDLDSIGIGAVGGRGQSDEKYVLDQAERIGLGPCATNRIAVLEMSHFRLDENEKKRWSSGILVTATATATTTACVLGFVDERKVEQMFVRIGREELTRGRFHVG